MNTSVEEMVRANLPAVCQPELPDGKLLDLMVSAYRAANLLDVEAITGELVRRIKARRKLH
jgi:hypothetical protein